MKEYKINSEYFKFLFDNVDFSVADHEIVFNDKGEPIDYKYIYANNVFCSSLNITLKELIGKSVKDVFPETEEFWIKKYYEVTKTGTPLTMTRYAKQFNKYFSTYTFKTAENCFAVSFKDVTELVRSNNIEDDIQHSNNFVSDISKIGFFEVNRITLKADVSEMFCEVVGLNKIEEGFFRETLLKLTHPEDYEKMGKVIKNIVDGEITELETEFRLFHTKYNDYHWMSFFVFATEFDESGLPFRFTGLVRDVQKEKNQQEEMEESEELFKEARRVADLTTFIYDVKTEKFIQSKELDAFFGIENLTTIEQFRKIVHPEDLEIYDEATKYTLRKSKGKVTIYRIIKNDEIRIIQSSVFAKSDSTGNALKVFGIVKDITEIERERRVAVGFVKSFELIFNSSPAGIFLLSKDFEIALENKTFRDFLNVETGKMKLSYLLKDNYDQVIEDLKDNKEIQHLKVSHLVNGKQKTFVINIVRIDEDFENDFEGTLVDITQQVVDEERILYLATHDVLTDLYNRNYFEEILIEKQYSYPLGMILCDIDGLKLINDAFGHLKGDELLQSFAKAIKGLSPYYIVSRIGGDEFSILVENSTEEELESIELRIKESIKELGLFGIDFEVSVGYAILDEEHFDYSRVFNKAENMMYRRKLTERSSRRSNALTTIMQTLHEKTEETKNHCERVGDYSSMLLYESGYKRTVDLDDIRFLSDVHDIGKIATPEAILNNPSKLTEEEYEEIKYHSEAGFKIIRNIIEKEDIAYGILYHHERYDGRGYPHGLSGESIPLYARILAIADSYDTMIRGRKYQTPITKDAALKEIVDNAGTQFDPKLANMFTKLMKEKND